jgi:hypothetical protein
LNDLSRELDCRREHQERQLRQMRLELENAKNEVERRCSEREAEVKERVKVMVDKEDKLREREKVITQLMLAGGGASSKEEGSRPSMESTLGSMRGGTKRGFDAFLGKFD